jgi:hypothetical protein
MRRSVLLPLTFLPPESVQLGRLVLNVQQPQTEFLDPCPVAGRNILVKEAILFQGEESTTKINSFANSLCHLLSLDRTKEKGYTTHVVASRVTMYLLNNSGTWFNDAIRNQDARQWIEKANRAGDDIFVITGFHTLLDARIYETEVDSNTLGGNVAVPIAEGLAAAGVPVPFPDVVDPSIAAEHQQKYAGTRGFLAKGEQVGAIQYRKIKFKWYNKSELRDKPLGNNMWETYLTFRGQSDNVVEVDLEDDLELADEPSIYVHDENAFPVPGPEHASMDACNEQDW